MCISESYQVDEIRQPREVDSRKGYQFATAAAEWAERNAPVLARHKQFNTQTKTTVKTTLPSTAGTHM
jgi:hypothetical protein